MRPNGGRCVKRYCLPIMTISQGLARVLTLDGIDICRIFVVRHLAHRLIQKIGACREMIKFGYTIAYVEKVEDELAFFEKAFGVERGFVDPSGDYGELATGDTVLAFANHELGSSNFPAGYVKGTQDKPLGVEIAMVTDDVKAMHLKALEHGAKELRGPVEKPWGQTVSYVVSPSGVLLEICTPVSAG